MRRSALADALAEEQASPPPAELVDGPSEAEERLVQRSFWDVVEMLVTGVAFGLIGLDLRSAVEAAEAGDPLVEEERGGVELGAGLGPVRPLRRAWRRWRAASSRRRRRP